MVRCYHRHCFPFIANKKKIQIKSRPNKTFSIKHYRNVLLHKIELPSYNANEIKCRTKLIRTETNEGTASAMTIDFVFLYVWTKMLWMNTNKIEENENVDYPRWIIPGLYEYNNDYNPHHLSAQSNEYCVCVHVFVWMFKK